MPIKFAHGHIPKSLLLIWFQSIQLLALCYFPNGESSDDLACDPNASTSPCCARGWTCLSNGVCERYNSSIVDYTYGRGTCTDRDWESSSCPQFCQKTIDDGVRVYLCDSSNHWCCDQNEVYKGCCSNSGDLLNLGAGTSVTLLGQAPVTTSSSSSQTISTSVSTTASSDSAVTPVQQPSGAASAQPSDLATPSKSNDLGVKVGAGVGVPLGIALLAALIYVAIVRQKRSREGRSSRDSQQQHIQVPPQVPYQDQEWKAPEQRMVHELHAEAPLPPQLPS